MLPEVDKQRNIDCKDNISATMFSEVGEHRNIDRKHNVSATMLPKLRKQGNIMFLERYFLACPGSDGGTLIKTNLVEVIKLYFPKFGVTD